MTGERVIGSAGVAILGVAFFTFPDVLSLLWPGKVSEANALWRWLLIGLFFALTMGEIALPELYTKTPYLTWWKTHVSDTGIVKYLVLFTLILHRLAMVGDTFSFYMWFFISMVSWMSWRSPLWNQVPLLLFQSVVLLPLIGAGSLWYSVYLYGAHTYPLVSPTIGGGAPLYISLALKKENQHIIGRMMGREKPDCIMHNVYLIHENAESLYVLANGYYRKNLAIAIPRSEVASLSYQAGAEPQQATCFNK
jgi:hypothetical protein